MSSRAHPGIRCLPSRRGRCIHICMPNVLTVRLPSSLLAKLDRKAAALGRARAEHVRQVLEADVAEPEPKPRRFACLSMSGKYSLDRRGDNEGVRRALRKQCEKKNR